MYVLISTPAFTCSVHVSPLTKKVIRADSIIRWSVGKPYQVLIDWCWKKFPGKVNITEQQQK